MKTIRKLHNHKIISNLQDEIYKLRAENKDLELSYNNLIKRHSIIVRLGSEYMDESNELREKISELILLKPSYTLYTGAICKKMPTLYYKNELN